MGIGLSTDLPGGVIVADWDFDPPWDDHQICWDYDAQDIVPEGQLVGYAKLLGPRLLEVLNGGRLLTRARPVEGLLCGRAVQSIPETVASCANIAGKLTLILDTGDTFRLRISLAVFRAHRRDEPRPIRKRLFAASAEVGEDHA